MKRWIDGLIMDEQPCRREEALRCKKLSTRLPIRDDDVDKASTRYFDWWLF